MREEADITRAQAEKRETAAASGAGENPVTFWLRKQTGLGAALTPETLAVWQKEQVRKIQDYAGSRCRFYERERDFTTPEELRAEPEAFLCVPPKEIARIITLRTSGSQGRPKRVFFTAEDLEATADFFTPGMALMTRPGQRVGVFMEGAGAYTIGGLLKKALARNGVECLVHGLIRDFDAAGKAAEGADCLVGIPGQLLRLARLHPELHPETVLLSGDYVPESVCRELRSVWGSEIFHHWGMTETGYGGGVECGAHAGSHLRHGDLLLEVVEPQTGKPVPDGTYGELVLTTLVRRGMPLIRYRTGDIGRLLMEPCGCGDRLPRLDKVIGRRENLIFLPGGDVISIHLLDEVLFGRAGIQDYSVIMTPEKEFSFRILGENVDLDEIRETLLGRWPGISFHLERVEELPPLGNGKRRIKRTDGGRNRNENCSDL